MNVNRVNHVNSGLMVVSCVAAYVFPFELFLFSYAVLGPLHYLTEISWLHDRGYFARTAQAQKGVRLDRLWLILVALTLGVMLYGVAEEKFFHRSFSPVWEIGLLYLVFVTAVVVAFVRSATAAAIVAVLAVAGLAIFTRSPLFFLIALFLTTVIHVFVFTAAFMVQGVLKGKSWSGFLSLGIFIVCALSFFVYVPNAAFGASEYVRQSYVTFEALNAQLIQLFGLGTGTTLAEIYDSSAGLVVMRFLAFAYTYHYLNWFSKTSIIKWHAIPKRRTALIGALWIAALVTYGISYEAGFIALYALSMLHVLLEFPLNYQSFAGIGKELGSLIRSGRARVFAAR